MSKYIVSIDQGTTSSRTILFDKSGNIVSSHQLEHEQIFPKAGWVEHDALEIWANTQKTITEAMRWGNATHKDIAAVGITNQRETTVVWNRHTGKPYHNAIVWQDLRTDAICKSMENEPGKGLMDLFKKRSGLPLSTYFAGPKIRWLLDNVPSLREDSEKGDAIFGTMDTWILWNLTGEHVTDVTNASRTMLMNLETLDWDEELLEHMDVPRAMLPKILPSSYRKGYGKTRANSAFGGEVVVAGILGDQQAATVGQLCFEKGDVKNTYGTGCFMLMNTGHQINHSTHGLLTTLCYQFDSEKPVYALEGSVAISGALVQWVRDNLELISSAPEIEALAAGVEDNGGVYFVPAFSGLYAPYWRSDARGVIVGLTRYITKKHIARATLEATAFQTRDVIDAMKADSGIDIAVLKVDGGMVVNNLMMQIQADVINTVVIRPKVIESTALGAAYAAGLAVGYWKSVDDIRDNWQEGGRFTPDASSSLRTEGYSSWQDAVHRSFGLARD